MPTPSTATKYTAMIAKSIAATCVIGFPSMGLRVVRDLTYNKQIFTGSASTSY
jgi:hypothetical protein